VSREPSWHLRRPLQGCCKDTESSLLEIENMAQTQSCIQKAKPLRSSNRLFKISRASFNAIDHLMQLVRRSTAAWALTVIKRLWISSSLCARLVAHRAFSKPSARRAPWSNEIYKCFYYRDCGYIKLIVRASTVAQCFLKQGNGLSRHKTYQHLDVPSSSWLIQE